ncbi:hypothetical protein BU24DRAFT_358557 [Aaosphaeria arxii CBS 175.79]|uniref:S-adenosyl-L-methionine-dependent methyltransferase n=1 Tax=Aaosphaeria arxii CBS 175.79 TaxID=1450172 RepID=A0A6A5XAD9_9PLEO|nr:uncharacterized protein BU24DRAFT_358557 [Aaosphaeria arxii CBS 175.79]KAF2009734.1 hypothetical protein BU24DRAFT_358557 [Aaosphaeria arxii CBS 175.79]
MAPIRLPSPIEESLPTINPKKLYGNNNNGVDKVRDAVHKDTFEVKENELHATKKSRNVTFENFYGHKPTRVDRRFDVTLSDHSYLPKIENPRADWVVTAATNAFRAYQHGDLGQVKRFATIGTGSGTDVIAALDIFPQIEAVALTDLHEDVVAAAKSNVLASTEKSDDAIRAVASTAVARAGDVLVPLKGEKPFDLIYENLPNIPLPNAGDLDNGQASSTYVGDRTLDRIPPFASTALLDLHYVALWQAKNFNLLSQTGAVLSSMGGRVDIETMLKLADAAGFVGRVVSLAWKEQSEPENVIGGYAEFENNGLGPFYFYPTAALEKVFANYKPASAALCRQQIEIKLAPHRLDATTALQRYREGERIGHTVVVLASVLKAT